MGVVIPRPGVRAGTPAARTRALLANAHKTGDPGEIGALEARLIEDIAADFIGRLLATSPPLSVETRTRLAALLTTGR